MQYLVVILLFVVVVGLFYAVDYHRQKKADKMTKELFLEKCKALIDKGKYKAVLQMFSVYPKITMLYGSELRLTLEEYARLSKVNDKKLK